MMKIRTLLTGGVFISFIVSFGDPVVAIWMLLPFILVELMEIEDKL